MEKAQNTNYASYKCENKNITRYTNISSKK
jgi:hypothetical protein